MAATSANVVSSRSHAILQMIVEHRNKTRNIVEEVRQGKLSLIDLAGSERAAASNNRGIRMVEGANINRSLLALGNCINILGDKHKKGSFVPYRDSKLTRLLKDSLGGNTRTVMIANVSPSYLCYEETHNTLKYASRAKNIKRRITRNTISVEQHVSRYKQIIDSLRTEIQNLKEELRSRNSTSVNNIPMQMPSSSQQQVQYYQQQLHIQNSTGDGTHQHPSDLSSTVVPDEDYHLIAPIDAELARIDNERRTIEEELKKYEESLSNKDREKEAMEKLSRDLLANFREKMEVKQGLMELEELNKQNATYIAHLQQSIETWKKEQVTCKDPQKRVSLQENIAYALREIANTQHDTKENETVKIRFLETLKNNEAEMKALETTLTQLKLGSNQNELELRIRVHKLKLGNLEEHAKFLKLQKQTILRDREKQRQDQQIAEMQREMEMLRELLNRNQRPLLLPTTMTAATSTKAQYQLNNSSSNNNSTSSNNIIVIDEDEDRVDNNNNNDSGNFANPISTAESDARNDALSRHQISDQHKQRTALLRNAIFEKQQRILNELRHKADGSPSAYLPSTTSSPNLLEQSPGTNFSSFPQQQMPDLPPMTKISNSIGIRGKNGQNNNVGAFSSPDTNTSSSSVIRSTPDEKHAPPPPRLTGAIATTSTAAIVKPKPTTITSPTMVSTTTTTIPTRGQYNIVSVSLANLLEEQRKKAQKQVAEEVPVKESSATTTTTATATTAATASGAPSITLKTPDIEAENQKIRRKMLEKAKQLRLISPDALSPSMLSYLGERESDNISSISSIRSANADPNRSFEDIQKRLEESFAKTLQEQFFGNNTSNGGGGGAAAAAASLTASATTGSGPSNNNNNNNNSSTEASSSPMLQQLRMLSMMKPGGEDKTRSSATENYNNNNNAVTAARQRPKPNLSLERERRRRERKEQSQQQQQQQQQQQKKAMESAPFHMAMSTAATLSSLQAKIQSNNNPPLLPTTSALTASTTSTTATTTTAITTTTPLWNEFDIKKKQQQIQQMLQQQLQRQYQHQAQPQHQSQPQAIPAHDDSKQIKSTLTTSTIESQLNSLQQQLKGLTTRHSAIQTATSDSNNTVSEISGTTTNNTRIRNAILQLNSAVAAPAPAPPPPTTATATTTTTTTVTTAPFSTSTSSSSSSSIAEQHQKLNSLMAERERLTRKVLSDRLKGTPSPATVAASNVNSWLEQQHQQLSQQQQQQQHQQQPAAVSAAQSAASVYSNKGTALPITTANNNNNNCGSNTNINTLLAVPSSYSRISSNNIDTTTTTTTTSRAAAAAADPDEAEIEVEEDGPSDNKPVISISLT